MSTIYLLLKNKRVKAIKDSKDISKHITSKVKHVMINVGLNGNEEYIFINPEKCITKLKECKIQSVLGVYLADCNDEGSDVEFEMQQITGITTSVPRTITELYSYLFTINRIHSFNEYISRYDSSYGYGNLNIDFKLFDIKLNSDKFTFKKSFSYDKSMPESGTVYFEVYKYLEELLSSFKLDCYKKIFYINYQHNTWDMVDNTYLNKVKLKDLIIIPVSYSNSLHVFNNLTCRVLNEITSVYIDFFLYDKTKLSLDLETVSKSNIDFDIEEYLEPLSDYGISAHGKEDILCMISILPLFYNIINTICMTNDIYYGDEENLDKYNIFVNFSYFIRNNEEKSFYLFDRNVIKKYSIGDILYKVYSSIN